MADRRMFSKSIIDSDAFLDMPLSTQALYFHLSMRADDDGFINNPRKIQRIVGCGNDDIKLLITKQFIIPFESGIVVIKHWRVHNYIQKDRYKPTMYLEEKSQLDIKPNKPYTIKNDGENDMDTPCIQDVSDMETQVRLGKVRLGKVSIEGEIEGVWGRRTELDGTASKHSPPEKFLGSTRRTPYAHHRKNTQVISRAPPPHCRERKKPSARRKRQALGSLIAEIGWTMY